MSIEFWRSGCAFAGLVCVLGLSTGCGDDGSKKARPQQTEGPMNGPDSDASVRLPEDMDGSVDGNVIDPHDAAQAEADAALDASFETDASEVPSDANVATGPLYPIISEVADPPIPGGRFVELYNPHPVSIQLEGLRFRRWYNGSTTNSGIVSLPAVELLPGETFVLAHSQSALENLYGTTPDLVHNMVIDGTGNDAYELSKGDEIIDMYGVHGVDGTGEPWDYTDSVAQRDLSVKKPTPVYDPAEWIIYQGGDQATPGRH